jgi:hypothetical protein
LFDDNMSEKTVIYVTTLTPAEVGHGGVHRSYQVLHDLQEVVGRDQVHLFTKHDLLAHMDQNGLAAQKNHKLKQWASYRAGTARRVIENPYRLIQRTQFATGLHPQILSYYEQQVRRLDKAVCVIEHAEFAELIPINQKYKIPTISCTQNLDALSQNFDLLSGNLAAIRSGKLDHKQKAGINAAIVDFGKELQILAQCDERLFISKLETGLVGGLGLSAQYYPYLPVGAIRQRLDSIRQSRKHSAPEPGLFVMIGTAAYGPIGKACSWVVESARDHGLPAGARIVVAGLGTDTLLSPGESVPGIELKGWVEQDEMDELLTQATAVLVPQRFGFGVPTRLAELSCAGIPVIGDKHSTFAVDPPPGFQVVDDSWTCWYEKISQFQHGDVKSSEDYEPWEETQPQPLGKVVKVMLA